MLDDVAISRPNIARRAPTARRRFARVVRRGEPGENESLSTAAAPCAYQAWLPLVYKSIGIELAGLLRALLPPLSLL